MPETQKLSIRLFKNIKSSENIVGNANLLMALRGFPLIDSILSLACITNSIWKKIFKDY